PHANPPEAKPPASSSPPRPLASPPPPPEVSRSPTVTAPEPLLSERSVATRSRRTFSSESSPSSVSFARLPRISRAIFASRDLPSLPFRRLPRPTLLVSLRTLTCALSTPSVSLSCPRTSSSPVASVESAHKCPYFAVM
ncbi:hypothetical protein ACHAXR_000666, partial [Thalassiosira sp. AJA248-18]